MYSAARRELAALTPATWSDDATLSLEQLMKLEYADALAHKTPAGETHPQVDLDPLLLRFILPAADYPKASIEEENLQEGRRLGLFQRCHGWPVVLAGARPGPGGRSFPQGRR